MLHGQAQPHREEAVAMLLGQAQSNREEASIALGYVNNLTEATLNRLNKQSQERQQMAANDERTRQRITAHKNKIRNQEKEQDPPDRAKPTAKSEPLLAGNRRGPPFKFQTISTLDNVESPAVKDDENPETTHEPKGKRGRPSNIRRTTEKHKPPHDTEKDENRTRTHRRKATKGNLVDQLAKHGWELQKHRKYKTFKT